MSDFYKTLRALNDAAHALAKTARKERDPRAKRLTELAWEIDNMMEQRPAPQLQEASR